MPEIINTNISALDAQRNLSKTNGQAFTAFQRLSSGLRINSAKDDAAGLAIAQRFTAQIKGLDQAKRNANDGISLSQTAEGALSTVTDNLQRIRELAIQSANATNSAADRHALQAEVNQLKQEIQRTATTTEFNGLKLLDGTFQAQNFQVGANANETIAVSISGTTTSDLGNYSVDAVNNTAGTVTNTANQGAGAISALGGTQNTIAAQTLTVASSLGTANIAVKAGETAYDIATAVNHNAETTGVTATAQTQMKLNNLSAAGTVSMKLSSGGAAATISATVNDPTNLSEVAKQINNASGITGITAQLSSDNSSITLKQSQGKDIKITNFDAGAGNTLDVTAQDATAAEQLKQGAGTNSVIGTGDITFNSSNSFSVSSSIDESAGSVLNVAGGAQVGSTKASVDTIDISTVQGANDAIPIIDAALATISGVRADLGAVQNRMSSTIANLGTTSENMSSARSRIQDADFAKETAALARTQVLQQAGISVLSQANAQPKQVLQLLR